LQVSQGEQRGPLPTPPLGKRIVNLLR
jgi:hypothetical protein